MDCIECNYPLIKDEDDEAYEEGPLCGSCEAGERFFQQAENLREQMELGH